MITYIGPESRGKWMEEEAARWGESFRMVPERTKIADHVNAILDVKCDYMIFDIEQYADSADVLASQILSVHQVNNAKVIIYAPGYRPTSNVIVALLGKQFKNYIFGVNLSDQKDELGKCLNGYYDTHSIKEFGYVEPVLQEEAAKEYLNFHNIGVVGANPRMGTTTQAIQIIKYLLLMGYKACYIEMNGHHYVETLKDWYEVTCDDNLGKITYCSVDMFYDLTKLQSVLKQGYDYYVYDYGVYNDPDFNKISFLERDFQIFVCGSGPDELEKAYQVLRNSFYNDVYYIFNLSPESDRTELLELMEDKQEQTFFSPYTPDPFVYCNSDIYQKMVPVENRNTPETEKKRFFRIRGKKGKNEQV
ncbi:hypothetical protein [Wansuia hejianensis]|uniref:Uncharacterized protein n=1 Tax=Wansuia hejianensis TaxID=2763667 RepID=A0A7G9GBX0_9FIRM|nr:hypothetical protein [Wansuia hejianensis]QNM08302.1 hypothetical protein H9Q79_15670 [Wansuia hejianensis]RHV84544.1 hypothetical protein DXA96_18820 [Lachnospiraceae bacterium OF09-33XD]